MKLLATPLVAALLACSGLHAETAPKKSPAQMQAQIDMVKEHLALRETRADAVLEDILDLDKEIEGQIGVITEKLSSMKDSEESRITVLQTKERTIKGLESLVAHYNQQRSLMLKEMQKITPKAPREDLSAAASAYDEKIEKRVEQIIALTQSLEKHKDLPKYNVRYSWEGTFRKRNPEQKRQQQLDNRNTATREKLIETIDSAVQRLETETAELESELKFYSREEQAHIRQMIERNKETIARRKAQKLIIINGPDATAQQTVSGSGAHELSKMIDAASNNLRTDIIRLSNLGKQYLGEKQAIASLQENLSQREAELAKSR